MFYPLLLTADETSTLLAASRGARSYRFRQRADAILAQARGQSVAQLARHYGRDTISRWIHAWEDRGLAALFDAPRAGRPPKLAPTAKKNL